MIQSTVDIRHLTEQARLLKADLIEGAITHGIIEPRELDFPVSGELESEVSELSRALARPLKTRLDQLNAASAIKYQGEDRHRLVRVSMLYSKGNDSFDIPLNYLLNDFFGVQNNCTKVQNELKKLGKLACYTANVGYTSVNFIISDRTSVHNHLDNAQDNPDEFPYELSNEAAGVTFSRSLIYPGVNYGVHDVNLISPEIERRYSADRAQQILSLFETPVNIEFRTQRPGTLLALLDRKHIHSTPTISDYDTHSIIDVTRHPIRLIFNSSSIPRFNPIRESELLKAIEKERANLRKVFKNT